MDAVIITLDKLEGHECTIWSIASLNSKFTLFLIKITRILLLGINLALILGVLFGIIESWKK